MNKPKKVVTKKEMKKKGKLSLSVYDQSGKEKSIFSLPKEIFGVKINKELLSTSVRVYLTNQRQGNASTKTRSEIKGSTRKIYRQKGTGNARHSDRKAPIFVGGGVVGGPRPKDYSLRLNKKQKRKALFASLTFRLKEKSFIIAEDSLLKIKPKTKEFFKFLKALKIEKEKNILLILPTTGIRNLVLSARNLPNVEIVSVLSINPYIILRSKKIIILEVALLGLEKHFLKSKKLKK